jgi:hypothetical protein
MGAQGHPKGAQSQPKGGQRHPKDIQGMAKGPLGTPKSMKTDKIQKGRVPKILGRVFPEKKGPCGSARAR